MRFLVGVILLFAVGVQSPAFAQTPQSNWSKVRMILDLKSIPSADVDAWNNAEGELDGKISFTRYRPNLRKFRGHPQLPQRLVITWQYDPTDSTGLPSSMQYDTLGAFETSLVTALDPNRLAILAFVFTYNGSCEWNFYFSDLDAVKECINIALASQPKLPIHLEAVDDPEWEEYSAVLKGIQGSE